MSSIQKQILAAIPEQLDQAADHDETKTMEGVTLDFLLDKAEGHVASARYGRGDAAYVRHHLIAAMNHEALALSVQ